ncbi:MAG: glycine--tRNA ligase [Chloroflexi bacterium]|nr:glycine--tRNA ligase [Chloroflexota bacterium]
MKADIETITSLAKRRGFVFPSAEIYGGFAAAYDYGPLGVELKRNIREQWWKSMVDERDDVVGLEAAIISNPAVWKAAGHLDAFNDPLVECLDCQARFREDHLADESPDGSCPSCPGTQGFTTPKQFNMMLSTIVGPVSDESGRAYMRPETAQGMFVNFSQVQSTMRKRLPFGIAQIGKSFRNEITVKQFIFRTREFEQMEMEFFCYPEDSDEWYEYWKTKRLDWYHSIGIRSEHLRLRAHDPEELSHYSSGTTDIEVHFPWGWGELEGIANRGNYDLTQHADHSGQKLTYFDQDRNEHIVPHVIEPAAGVDRIFLTLLLDAYDEEKVGEDTRTVLRLSPKIAPVNVAVLPLSRNEKLTPTARNVMDVLRSQFKAQYDDAQSIGRRYRRQDEIGTPLCITVDFETMEDDAVTIRNRDTMAQERVPISGLIDACKHNLEAMTVEK